MANNDSNQIRHTNEIIFVTAKDLPLRCPMPGKTLWSAHPRVFLPLKEPGEVLCPYCSAKYIYKKEE